MDNGRLDRGFIEKSILIQEFIRTKDVSLVDVSKDYFFMKNAFHEECFS